MKNIFYVYIYFDTRKNDEFVYDDLTFNYKPFYVGKGSNGRYIVHIREAKNKKGTNLYKEQTIRNIIKETGENPKILIYKKELIESESCRLETKLILKIGRKDMHEGPLLNLTNGGEGYSHTKLNLTNDDGGYDHTKKHKDYISKKYTGKGNPFYGKHHSKETKKKLSKSLKGINAGDKNGAKQKEARRLISLSRQGKIEWKFTSPENKIFVVKNCTKFCNENKLSISSIRKVVNGERQYHKDWICERIIKE